MLKYEKLKIKVISQNSDCGDFNMSYDFNTLTLTSNANVYIKDYLLFI